ncbi:MAG: NAD(P)H-hydrate dehydratase [Thermoplasmata archaeon]
MPADDRRPFSSLEMAVVEANALALGVSLTDLMAAAGRVVAEEAARRLPPPPARVAIIIGPGNNGGDGLAAAIELTHRGYRPELWRLPPPERLRGAAVRRFHEEAARQLPIHSGVPDARELAGFPLLIDGILGTGQAGPLRPPYREAVASLRGSHRPILAIDLPTGVEDPEGIWADWTVALTGPKAETPADRRGEEIVRSIGIPPEAWQTTGPGEFQALRPWSHPTVRGRSGRLLIVGGGPYAGAPALTGRAALRTGAERATLLIPGRVAPVVQGFGPDLIVQGLGSGGRWTREEIAPVTETIERLRPGAVAVGMGAGDHPETRGFFEGLRDWLDAHPDDHGPVLYDADALAVLVDRSAGASAHGPAVFATPNLGEYRRWLQGSAEPTDGEVADRARMRGLHLLLKGSTDWLSDGPRTVRNDHHHRAMTVGGMGDVLDGVLGGLLAQGIEPWVAGRLAMYWVGEAGRRAARLRGFGLLASDVIEEIPRSAVEALGGAPDDQA